MIFPKKILSETWTHPPASIVISDFWKKNSLHSPLWKMSINNCNIFTSELKIYKSLPKTYNSIRMTIHQSCKTQLFLHKLCKLLHKMAANINNGSFKQYISRGMHHDEVTFTHNIYYMVQDGMMEGFKK